MGKIKWVSLFCFLFIFTSSAYAQLWAMSTRYETAKKSKDKQSVVQFNKGKLSVVYRPTAPPYGVVIEEKAVINNQNYFITGWAHGARSVMFKIFEPEAFAAKPLCEVISFSEETELRIVNNKLEIKVADDSPDTISDSDELPSESEKWVVCSDLPAAKK